MKESDRLKLFNTMNKLRKKNFVEGVCGNCQNLHWCDEKEHYWCGVFTSFFFLWGHGECSAKKLDEDQMARECFAEDQHRELLKPGGGEKSDRTHKIFTKERMKDNRPIMWDGDLSS